ncbi:MAG: ATPase [Clostridiales bacterium]|jgi:bifunctional DNA-binding transcriptional regulator/antitoxin component of YhaV-PrlF toxin-antitoxin module|nr:ATPase [Clostridiales bacterium]
MDMLQLIDALEELLEGGAGVPLTGKCLVSKDEAIEIARQMRLSLPEEIRNALKIAEDKELIIKKAENEAQRIIKGADAKFGEIVDQHEITSAAYKKHNEIVSAAQLSAHEIKRGAYDYVDKLLLRVERLLGETLETVSANHREIESLKK